MCGFDNSTSQRTQPPTTIVVFWDIYIFSVSMGETYTAWKVSVFVVILVLIFPHSDWIQRNTSENTDQNNSESGHFLRSVKEAERQPWINDNNNLRKIHWWPMKSYNRRKAKFCSLSQFPNYSQNMNSLGSRVWYFTSWISGSNFGPPPRSVGFFFF